MALLQEERTLAGPGPRETTGWGQSEFARAAVALVAAALLVAGFLRMENFCASLQSFHPAALPWDGLIPLEPAWVWIYLLYYPFCVSAAFFPGVFRRARVFWAILLGFLFQFAAAGLIFYFFPTRIVHPSVPGVGLSAQALRELYAVDSGHCIFPSLHVANTVFVSLVATRMLAKRWSALFFIVAGIIAASTVLVKQHFLVDIPSGALLGILAYWLATRPALEGPKAGGLPIKG
ncbi:MAG TPA: phosphatase PAP2 family protein [Elusimicrobiota bacterium]|nr:phosphatase PAP2 family protein [Elusimicrobiota bacterium]